MGYYKSFLFSQHYKIKYQPRRFLDTLIIYLLQYKRRKAKVVIKIFILNCND